MAAVDCGSRMGLASAASPVAWAGGAGSRDFVEWLPKFGTPIAEVRGNKVFPTREFWNFLREMADRVGGIQGASIPMVQQALTDTQTQLVVTTNYATQVGDFAAQVANTATATAEVASNNSLSGSGTIPPTGSPPNRPNFQVQ